MLSLKDEPDKTDKNDNINNPYHKNNSINNNIDNSNKNVKEKV